MSVSKSWPVGPFVILMAAVVVSAVGCDDIVKVRNLAPEVALVGVCAVDERVFFEVTVQDFEEDDVDVEITAGGVPVLVGSVGDGALGLRSDRGFPGKHHWVEWAATVCEGDAVCPTALCHTLTDGVLSDAGRCAPLADDPTGASLGIVATDGEDESKRVSFNTQTEAGASLRPCDFAQGAHE